MTSYQVREPQIGKVSDLAVQMKLARRPEGLSPVTFLIGAGCSVTAGVPAVTEIARRLTTQACKKLGLGDGLEPAAALSALTNSGKLAGYKNAGNSPDWAGVYDALFEEIYSSPAQARNIFKEIVRESNGMINWTHLVLGELAAKRWVSTTITTNFDLLVLDGHVRAGVIPVVSDGLESLYRLDDRPEFPQILQINGSIHSYRVRNRAEELADIANNVVAGGTFRNLFSASEVMVIVGYAGREPHIMKLLSDAAKEFPDKHIYWCLYRQNPAELESRAREFLSHSRNARLLVDQHSDKFFLDLSNELGLGPPKMFSDPVGYLRERTNKIVPVRRAEDGGELKLSEIADELRALNQRLGELEECQRSTNRNEVERETAGPAQRKRKKRQPRGMANVIEQIAIKDGVAALLRRAGELTDRVEADYDASAVDEAKAAYEKALELIDRKRVSDLWASAQVGRGRLLRLVGTRGETAALRKAAEAFRLALEEYTREYAPLQWAMTQNSLGNALKTLGERGDDAALREAAGAYRLALEEYKREDAPHQWAATQNNLGIALKTLGARGDDAALREAVVAYRLALQERTRERTPLDWAITQNNLGAALQSLGELGDDAALWEAVDAYRLALEELTRERAPLDWAATQNNLGNALQTLGARGDDAALREAVGAFRLALEERTRERAPLAWAETQNNLGNALQTLGAREDDAALKEAVGAYRLALAEFTRERAPFLWAATQNNLGIALQTLGARGDDAALWEAVAAYRLALEELTRERAPLQWAMTQNNLGIALKTIGARGDDAMLREAVGAYRHALKEHTRERAPLLWAMTIKNLALAMESQADRAPDRFKARDTYASLLPNLDAAIEEFRNASATYYIEKAERDRARIAAKAAGAAP